MMMNEQLIKEMMSDCTLCPRDCHIDRAGGRKGYCRETDALVVARAALHLWEEPCISGEQGSGTVFFSGCPVGCVYCQNRPIARGLTGKEISIERLAEIYLELQGQGANNINLVTPSHYVPQIIRALELAREQGLHLPVVYNCGGYEKVETLRLLRGYVDIYLPDFKYRSSEVAKKYSNCADYFEVASAAIQEMQMQVGEPIFDAKGMLKRGVIVRHMMLPGYLQDSKNVIAYLHQTYGDSIFISIMSQYTPLANMERYPEINRTLPKSDYDELIEYAVSIGVENGFVQDGETALESFIPAFDDTGV